MRVLIIVFFTFLSLCCKANKIDQLKTLDDVNAFMKKINKKWQSSFFQVKPDSTSKLPQTKFLKLDINNDGLTDLILNGENIIAVTDDSKGGYNINLVNTNGGMTFKTYTLMGVDTVKPAKIIVKIFYDDERFVHPTVYDTLVVKFGGFIEYNSHPDQSSVAKLSFSTTMCFGTCPVFDLYIESDGSAEYDANKYNSETGKFKGSIKTAKLNEIFALIGYLDLRKLQDSYKVDWTDDQTVKLEVKYKGGETKSIADYGLQGTLGLRLLYQRLFALRESQMWYER